MIPDTFLWYLRNEKQQFGVYSSRVDTTQIDTIYTYAERERQRDLDLEYRYTHSIYRHFLPCNRYVYALHKEPQTSPDWRNTPAGRITPDHPRHKKSLCAKLLEPD